MLVHSYLNEASTEALKYAILVYTSEGHAYATFNPVALDPRRKAPVIGAGRALDRATFAKIAAELDGAPQTKGRALIPPALLIADADLLVWYVPSHRRRIYFQTGNKTFDAAANGRNALHPPLLFLARGGGMGRDLYVWALGGDTRPELSTPLFRAPYLNIYGTGHLCEGNYRLPDHFRPEGVPDWEKAFFDTHFSHSNIDQRELTRHPHGHNALWQEMVKERGRGVHKQFPVRYLVPLTKTQHKKPAPLTVAEVIADAEK